MGHKATGRVLASGKKPLIYAVLFFQLALIGSLIKGIQISQKSKERVEMLKKTKADLEKENAKLQADAKYVESDYYVEKVAREELQKAKPGETVVIMPEERVQPAANSGEKNVNKREEKNWEKWWDLIVN